MVSIIITAYNVENYIEQSIKSALNQSLKDIEVVVVLDKPTDNTEAIVKSIKDDRLKIVENEKNIGAGLSRRMGITQAKGDYIILLDGDDWLEPNFIEHLYQRAKEENADIVSGGVTIREENGYYEVQCVGDRVCEGYEKVTRYWGLKTVFMNNRLIARHLFDKVLYCHRRYIEDTPTIIPMLWYANKVVYVDEVGYNYRVNPKSLSHTADWFKEWVFKGLCYCDLVEFFNAHDPELYKHLDIRQYVCTIFAQLRQTVLTVETVNQYPSEFCELMMRLSNLVSVESVKYKQLPREHRKDVAF